MNDATQKAEGWIQPTSILIIGHTRRDADQIFRFMTRELPVAIGGVFGCLIQKRTNFVMVTEGQNEIEKTRGHLFDLVIVSDGVETPWWLPFVTTRDFDLIQLDRGSI